MRFIDGFFSFLRRHTQLLNTHTAVESVQQCAAKHVEIARKEAAVKKEKEREAAVKKVEQEDVIDVSTSSATAQPASSSSSSSSSPTSTAASSSTSSSSSSTQQEPASPGAEPKDADDDLPTPINNGGITDKYSWSQSLGEVVVSIPLPSGTTSRQLRVDIGPDSLWAGLKGSSDAFLSGEPDERIDSGDATWTIEDEKDSRTGRVLRLYLPKLNKMSWWRSVVKGGPAINTKKIVPENSKLEDLDADTRSTVEKMMFDQRQKQMGRPTSDEMQKQAALKRFMEMHPEMDFSQAKISM